MRTTENSPVLITFGQPRTGNFVFANEVAKMAPIIFRHVNNSDLVADVSLCYKDASGNCINEYNQAEIRKSLFNYKKVNPINTKFYPWHINGLIFNYEDRETNHGCVHLSETRTPDCSHVSSVSFQFHIYYYGINIGQFWNPEMFPYFWEDSTCCDVEMADEVILMQPKGRGIWGEYETYQKYLDYYHATKKTVNDGVCIAYSWGSKIVTLPF